MIMLKLSCHLRARYFLQHVFSMLPTMQYFVTPIASVSFPVLLTNTVKFLTGFSAGELQEFVLKFDVLLLLSRIFNECVDLSPNSSAHIHTLHHSSRFDGAVRGNREQRLGPAICWVHNPIILNLKSPADAECGMSEIPRFHSILPYCRTQHHNNFNCKTWHPYKPYSTATVRNFLSNVELSSMRRVEFKRRSCSAERMQREILSLTVREQARSFSLKLEGSLTQYEVDPQSYSTFLRTCEIKFSDQFLENETTSSCGIEPCFVCFSGNIVLGRPTKSCVFYHDPRWADLSNRIVMAHELPAFSNPSGTKISDWRIPSFKEDDGIIHLFLSLPMFD